MSAHAASGVEALSRWLGAEGIEHRVLSHAATADALSEAHAAWLPVEQTVKTLVLCDHDALIVVAVPASERLDLHKLRAELGRHRSLQLASESQIARRLPNYEVGAIPPLGPDAVDVRVVDRRLLTYNRVLCSGGDHRHGILLDTMDLVRAGDALVADVCAERGERS
jgi:prolyl-tRNA editing enzyme YbaK/EbsC (Cys-tRNA(Pro) deacylase)